MRVLFGPAEGPKLHKLMAYLLDEVILRGNFRRVDTGLNESLHKLMKIAWLRINHRIDDYALELMTAEEMSVSTTRLLDAKVRKSLDHSATGIDSETEAEPEADVKHASRHTCGREVSAAGLGQESGISNVTAVLDVASCALVTTCGSVFILGKARRYDGRRHVVRARKRWYGRPHVRWVRYATSAGVERIGRARVILRGVERHACCVVVVEPVQLTVQERICPLSAYGCQRLRRVTSAGQGQENFAPALDVFLRSAIKAVLCVEMDWVDRVQPHALDVIPEAVPTSADEVRLQHALPMGLRESCTAGAGAGVTSAGCNRRRVVG